MQKDRNVDVATETDRNQESVPVYAQIAHPSAHEFIASNCNEIERNWKIEKCIAHFTCFRSLIFVSHFVWPATFAAKRERNFSYFFFFPGCFRVFFRASIHWHVLAMARWLISTTTSLSLSSYIQSTPPVPIDPIPKTHIRIVFEWFHCNFAVFVLYSECIPNSVSRLERRWIELNIIIFFSNSIIEITKSPFHLNELALETN